MAKTNRVAAAALLLLLVAPQGAVAATDAGDAEPGLALALAAFRAGICTAIVTTREGVATAGTGPTPDLKIKAGQEDRFVSIGKACSAAAE